MVLVADHERPGVADHGRSGRPGDLLAPEGSGPAEAEWLPRRPPIQPPGHGRLEQRAQCEKRGQSREQPSAPVRHPRTTSYGDPRPQDDAAAAGLLTWEGRWDAHIFT